MSSFNRIALHPGRHASFELVHDIFFIRVDARNEAVYELVAEPIPEPQAGEPQAEAAAEPDPEDLVNPADLQGKPRSITHKFSISMFI